MIRSTETKPLPPHTHPNNAGPPSERPPGNDKKGMLEKSVDAAKTIRGSSTIFPPVEGTKKTGNKTPELKTSKKRIIHNHKEQISKYGHAKANQVTQLWSDSSW